MKNKKIMAAIIALSVIQMGTVVISSILADISEAFPQESDSTIQFLMTFPSLTVLVSSVASALLAIRIPKKYIAATGSLLFALSGLLAFLFHSSLVLMYVWAGIMGIGIGFAIPMATSLVADCFTDKEQQKLMGWQSSASNGGGMIMTFIGGFLALAGWNYTYLIYTIAIPGMILALCFVPGKLTKPGNDYNTQKTADGSSNIFRAFVTPKIFGAFVAAFAVTMLYNNVPANVSMYLAEKNLGGSSSAGIASAILLMSAMIAGILFGKIVSKTGPYVMVLGFGVLCVGQIIFFAAASIWVVYIGCLIGGATMSLVMPWAMCNATQCKGVKSEVATMITLAGTYLGAFCTPVITWLSKLLLKNDTVAYRLLFSSICAGVIAIIYVIKNLLKQKNPNT